MQRIPFAISVLVVAAAIVSLRGGRTSDNKQEKQAGTSVENSLNRSLQAPWESGITFVMQWNDACKKLLFDGYPICHEKPVVYEGWHGGCRIQITDGPSLTRSMPASEHPDEYSFHVGNVGCLGASLDSAKQDGRIHYGMEWNYIGTQSASPNSQHNFINEMFNDNAYVLWSAHNAEGGPASERYK